MGVLFDVVCFPAARVALEAGASGPAALTVGEVAALAEAREAFNVALAAEVCVCV